MIRFSAEQQQHTNRCVLSNYHCLRDRYVVDALINQNGKKATTNYTEKKIEKKIGMFRLGFLSFASLAIISHVFSFSFVVASMCLLFF